MREMKLPRLPAVSKTEMAAKSIIAQQVEFNRKLAVTRRRIAEMFLEDGDIDGYNRNMARAANLEATA